MLLAVDIGNTNIVIGAFSGNKITRRQREVSKNSVVLKRVPGYFNAVYIASVVPALTKIVKQKVRKLYKVDPVIVDWKMIKGLNIAVKNKGQVGIDRLVNAVAAVTLYGKPLIIIDFGTATTFCVVDRSGKYLGGAITSGLAISRDVLHERTAKLPLVKIARPGRAIGRNTAEAMKSGLFYGYIEMVEGMVARLAIEMKAIPKVVATGGLAKVIAKGTRIFDAIDPDLTLKGLNIIYKERRVR